MKYGGFKIVLGMDPYSDEEEGGGDGGDGGKAAKGGSGDRKVTTRSRREPKSPPTAVGGDSNKILCLICGDGAVRHIHYGGYCCFSCKAFFRRAVNWQNKNTREFQCKFDGNCEITVKNRKTCQSCRFEKCVRTGMNPSWVLSDQQRRKRFKKYREADTLSPDTSQDSSRECESAVSTATAEPSSNRRRAKSAPAPRADLIKLDEQPLPASQPVSPLDRDFGDAVSPFKAPDVSMIKLEPDICRMGPLPDDQPPQPFCQTDAAGGGGAYSLDSKQPIKEEIMEGGGGGDFELDSMDKLENLIFDCNFTRDFSDEIRLKRSPSSSSASDRLGNQLHDEACGGRGGLLSVDDDGDAFAAAVAASNPATTSPAYVRTSPMLHLSPPPSQQQLNANSSFPCSPNFASSPLASPSLTAAATARLELSGRETMSLMKLEMSFENSNSSLPQMSPETESIWTTVMLSCDLASLQNHLTTSLLSEAVELCLRRNLMFLQENPDFTSLTLDTRKQLYIANMGSMCHVRGVMQRVPQATAAANQFTCVSSGDNNLFQISYKNQATGQIRRWNLFGEDNLTMAANNAASNDPFSTSSLLQLAESIWRLELGRSVYLLLLLLVLFSSQGCSLHPQQQQIVDKFQNKYLALLYRYLNAEYGESQAKVYTQKIIKFVLALLTTNY